VVLYHVFMGAVTPLPFCHCNETTGSSSTRKKSSNAKSRKMVDNQFNHETKRVAFNLWRRTIVTCFFWMILPFLTSSNLLVYVGFVIADRTLYLPSFGSCLLLVEGLVSLPSFLYQSSERATISNDGRLELESLPKGVSSSPSTMNQGNTSILPLVCASIILVLYTGKQQVQTKRWSNGILLWGEAYRINPNSCMNGNQYGISLIVESRHKDGAKILTISHKREMSGRMYMKDVTDAGGSKSDGHRDANSLYNVMVTRFKLVLGLINSGNCDKARPLIEEGVTLIDDSVRDMEMQMRNLGLNPNANAPTHDAGEYLFLNAKDSLMNAKAYLLVSKSRCATNIPSMGHIAYEAVMAKPDHNYAMTHAREVNGIIENIRKAGIDPMAIKMHWEMSADGQAATWKMLM